MMKNIQKGEHDTLEFFEKKLLSFEIIYFIPY